MNTNLPKNYKIGTTYLRVPESKLSEHKKGTPVGGELWPYVRSMKSFVEKSLMEEKPAPHGGACLVYIYDEDNEPVATGSSICSRADTFSYKIGRSIALGRAIKMLELIQNVPQETD